MTTNPPLMNLLVDQWSCPVPLTNTPMAGAPVHTAVPCGARMPRWYEVGPWTFETGGICDLVLMFLPPYMQRFDYLADLVSPQYNQLTVFELPGGSKQFFLCMQTRYVGHGFPNEHQECFCYRIWKTGFNKSH